MSIYTKKFSKMVKYFLFAVVSSVVSILLNIFTSSNNKNDNLSLESAYADLRSTCGIGYSQAQCDSYVSSGGDGSGGDGI